MGDEAGPQQHAGDKRKRCEDPTTADKRHRTVSQLPNPLQGRHQMIEVPNQTPMPQQMMYMTPPTAVYHQAVFFPDGVGSTQSFAPQNRWPTVSPFTSFNGVDPTYQDLLLQNPPGATHPQYPVPVLYQYPDPMEHELRYTPEPSQHTEMFAFPPAAAPFYPGNDQIPMTSDRNTNSTHHDEICRKSPAAVKAKPATRYSQRTRSNRKQSTPYTRNSSPPRQPGKKPGDKNIPIWPSFPLPTTALPPNITLYQLAHHYPNHLTHANLDGFIQRRWSPSEIMACLPQSCLDDILARPAIDKTMWLVKRIQKREAVLRQTGVLARLYAEKEKEDRGEAGRGCLRGDGRPRALLDGKGPSQVKPRRGWVARQRRKEERVVGRRVEECDEEVEVDAEGEEDTDL